MVKFAVCDDEPFMLKDIAARISKYMEEKNLAYKVELFESAGDVLESGRDFDVLFLDIQMAKPDGMEAARLLRSSGFSGIIIFITVLCESVFDAFEVQAFDFLVKPVNDEKFGRTVDRVLAQLAGREQNLTVQKGNSCRIIPYSQIVYCEVMGRKIYIHCEGGEVVDYYDKLEELAGRMGSGFFRCHRSYLVNLARVRGYGNGEVELSGGEKVPVSRLRERELVQALLVHMKERRR